MHLRACRLLAITVFVYGCLGSGQAFAQNACITNPGEGVSVIATATNAVTKITDSSVSAAVVGARPSV